MGVLNVGLTGGIGAGKSAVSDVLRECGALVIDADRLAREVVEPGTPALQAIRSEFGGQVLRPDGALDRPALAAVVFGDDAARARLNAIVHPAVRDRSAQLAATAAPGQIVVQDIPLLAEGGMAPAFHLVLVVTAPLPVRLARLADSRGMPEAEARARIAAQATDEQRAAVADVLIDNSDTPRHLRVAVGDLVATRLAPYAANLAAGRPALEWVDRVDPAALGRARARIAACAEGARVHVDGDHLLAYLPAGPDTTGALNDAGWFGEPGQNAYRSADPGQPFALRIAAADRPS